MFLSAIIYTGRKEADAKPNAPTSTTRNETEQRQIKRRRQNDDHDGTEQERVKKSRNKRWKPAHKQRTTFLERELEKRTDTKRYNKTYHVRS
ncbi:hypothetical protein Trydic_g3917 [Trypoxylus dichotomus]